MKLQETGDGSLTLHSERYGQTFHSHHGALTESRHVFLEASGVGARLRAGDATNVLEVGFGTGLNCWLTADEATAAGADLEFMSLEQELLPAEQLEQLDFGRHLRTPSLLDAYLAARPDLPASGNPRVALAKGVTLELRLGQAQDKVLPKAWADAVYHDAFSPDANPELWEVTFLAGIADCLKPGGILVTYSVKGEVRRRLQELGFEVERLPGPPGGKRQMLRAVRQ